MILSEKNDVYNFYYNTKWKKKNKINPKYKINIIIALFAFYAVAKGIMGHLHHVMLQNMLGNTILIRNIKNI